MQTLVCMNFPDAKWLKTNGTHHRSDKLSHSLCDTHRFQKLRAHFKRQHNKEEEYKEKC